MIIIISKRAAFTAALSANKGVINRLTIGFSMYFVRSILIITLILKFIHYFINQDEKQDEGQQKQDCYQDLFP